MPCVTARVCISSMSISRVRFKEDTTSPGFSHTTGNSGGAMSGCSQSTEHSHSSASTNLGPGRLNIASPSTNATRPSRTARKPGHHSFCWKIDASRFTASRSRPQQHTIIKSGSLSQSLLEDTAKDFPPPAAPLPGLSGWQPPARSISCGVQWPPT